jgi:hypothetical protein
MNDPADAEAPAAGAFIVEPAAGAFIVEEPAGAAGAAGETGWFIIVPEDGLAGAVLVCAKAGAATSALAMRQAAM